MPIYEYRCSACGHRTEILHGINDDGPRFCPACGAEGTLRKAITAPSIVFKGSGWAKKDRRPAPAGTSKAKGSDSDTDASSPPKGDTKSSGTSTDSSSASGSQSAASADKGGD